MQAWESILVKADADSDYKGTAGMVVSVDNDKKSLTARMDKDGETVTLLQNQVTVLR